MSVYRTEWVLPEYENNLVELRHKLELNIAKMTSILDVPYHEYRSVELGKISIYRKNGTIRPWILTLCKKFHCHIDDLFPREACAIKEMYTKEDFVELYDNHWSSHPYMDSIEYLELRLDIQKIINGRLTKDFKSRLHEVIRLYFFEDMTYEQISEIYKVNKEVIRQNIQKAIRILRRDLSYDEDWIQDGAYTDEYLRNRPDEYKSEDLLPVIVNVNPSLTPGAIQIRHVSSNDFSPRPTQKVRLIDFDNIFATSMRTAQSSTVKNDPSEQ